MLHTKYSHTINSNMPMCYDNLGIFEKRIGIEATDKEIYVVNEPVDEL